MSIQQSFASDVVAAPFGIGSGPAGSDLFCVDIATAMDAAIVTPIGELDLLTAGPLEEALLEIENAGTPRLVLDLRRLSFMDGSGLHVLLRTKARARHSGTRLEVVCCPGQVRRLLQLTELDRALDIADRPAIWTPIDGRRA